MLVGREREVEVIESALEQARHGQSSTLVIAGEAGIGKTALLESTVERACDLRVIRAAGSESESELPYSGLSALLRPVLDRLPELPAPQQAALTSALALGPSSPFDPFTAYAAVLSLLAAAADDRPLLCAVDDVHWLDAASQQALLFAARRLGAEGVVLLFARREREQTPFADARLPSITLAGLSQEAAKELLERASRAEVSDAVSKKLYAASQGSPLALLEAVQTVTPDQLSGRDPIDDPVLFGRGVDRAFASRIALLDEEARRALILLAAGDGLDASILAAATSIARLEGSTLAAAEEAGLVSLENGRARFGHPLVRSTVYHGASSEERREAHRVLAEAMPEDTMRRAWQLALAATTPDEDVATLLEDTAADARERSGFIAAARALERAAQLSPVGEAKARRLVEAASDCLMAGNVRRVFQLLEEAKKLPLAPELRIETRHLQARAEIFGRDPMAGHAILVDAARELTDSNPDLAVKLLAEASFPCFATIEARLGLETAERAYELSARVGPEAKAMAALALQQASYLIGDTARSEALLSEFLPLVAASDPFVAANLLQGPTLSLIYLERFDEARQLVNRVLTAARSAGALSMLVLPLGCLAELEFRVGNWAAAAAAGAEAAQVGRETNHLNLAYVLAVLARIEAGQGREDELRAHVREATDVAEAHLAEAMMHFTGHAVGLLASSLGRYDDVLAALEPVAQSAEARSVDNPTILPWQPDLIEAYFHLGRTNDAERALDRFERVAEAIGLTPLAVARRCRALLAGNDALEECFEHALELHDGRQLPFERARTQLLFGERLRRAGRRSDARRPLRAAHAEFERLGARLWARRASVELRATGEAVRQSTAPMTESLTAHELQVALAVSQGATNKEVAAQLFLSPKTIDFHLRNIYRKLDIRSRTELARVILEASPGPVAEPVRAS